MPAHSGRLWQTDSRRCDQCPGLINEAHQRPGIGAVGRRRLLSEAIVVGAQGINTIVAPFVAAASLYDLKTRRRHFDSLVAHFRHRRLAGEAAKLA